MTIEINSTKIKIAVTDQKEAPAAKEAFQGGW